MKKKFLISAAMIAAIGLVLLPTALASFSDVSSSNANYDAIQYAEQNNIVSGYPNGTFKPGNTINRAEFTKIAVGAFSGYNSANDSGTNIYSLSGLHFSDLLSGQWYVPYLRKAVSLGIISGYPDGTFKPSNEISFAEASKIIVVAYGGDFAGAGYPPNQWYAKYVNALGNMHAIPTTINSFDQQITRGEMVEMIYRMKAGVTTKDS